jgi:hypothetical protein
LSGGGGPTAANAAKLPDQKSLQYFSMLQSGLISPQDFLTATTPKDPEVKDFQRVRNPDGTVSIVGLTKDGKVINTNQTPFVEPKFENMGGFVGAIDPITGKMTNVGNRTQSPDSRASNAIAQGNLSMRQLEFANRPERMVTVMDGVGNPITVPESQGAGLPKYSPQAAAQLRKENESKKARGQMSTALGELRGYYDQLKNDDGIVSQDQGLVGNTLSRLGSSAVGQTVGGTVGTKNQMTRDKIEQTRPLLLNLIKEATGMSAQQMNSNAEMQLYLRAATDPTLSYEANVQALENLDKLFGIGKGAAEKQVKRTGTYNGRKVIEYTDGSVDYAD